MAGKNSYKTTDVTRKLLGLQVIILSGENVRIYVCSRRVTTGNVVNILKFRTHHSILWPGLLFMELFLKILCGMANCVDPDQILEQSDLELHCFHESFCQNSCVQNIRTFTLLLLSPTDIFPVHQQNLSMQMSHTGMVAFLLTVFDLTTALCA